MSVDHADDRYTADRLSKANPDKVNHASASTGTAKSEDFGRMIADETAKWGKAVKFANVSAD